MAKLLTLPLARIQDANGVPYPGGKLYAYVSGGTTPTSVYTTSALNVAHANPVVADAGGFLPAIFLDPAVTYRFVAKTAAGAAISGMDFDPVSVTSATDIQLTPAGTGAIATTVAEAMSHTVNLMDWVPLDLRAGILDGTSTTDVSGYLNAGFAVAEGRVTPKVILPPGGYYATDTVHFAPPDGADFEAVGEIRSTVSGKTAVRIGPTAAGARTLFMTMRGLKVRRTNAANIAFTVADMTVGGVTSGSSGVELTNIGLSDLDVRRCDGFTKGVLCNGTSNTVGLAQNLIRLGYICDNKFNIFLTASGGGWCNENIYLGANDCKWSGDYPNFAGCYGVWMDDIAAVNLNNNRFEGISFQSHSYLTRAARIAGSHNVIDLGPRYENADEAHSGQDTVAFEFIASSLRCAIRGRAYQIKRSNISDLGQENEVETIEGIDYFRATGADQALLRLRSNVSNSARIWEGRSVAGAVTSYAETGGRIVTNTSLYADGGIRYSTSSGNLDDRGLFVSSGSPETVVSARVGSIYMRIDGGAGTTMYVKESGSGNTGWVAK